MSPMSDHDSPMRLIRTSSRPTLRRGLSHPVGAEAISRVLAGCPQFDELSILFLDKPTLLHPNPTECPDFASAFSVHFNAAWAGWGLNVSAVPSTVRNTVRQLLETTGLPGVGEWLARPRPETWYEGHRQFEVGYAVAPPRVCFVESQNYRVGRTEIRNVPVIRAVRRVNPGPRTPDAPSESK